MGIGASDVDFGNEAVEAAELRNGRGRGPDGCLFPEGLRVSWWSGMLVLIIYGAL